MDPLLVNEINAEIFSSQKPWWYFKANKRVLVRALFWKCLVEVCVRVRVRVNVAAP